MVGLRDLRRQHPVHEGYPHFNERGDRLVPTPEEYEEACRLLTGQGAFISTEAIQQFQAQARDRKLPPPPDGAGIVGSAYLEKRDAKTGKITGAFHSNNILTDRGLNHYIKSLCNLVNWSSGIESDTTDCWVYMILSSSRLVEQREESDLAQNPRAGAVVGSFARTTRDSPTSYFSGNSTIVMSFLLGATHAIDGIPFSSIGWAQGADAGATGTQSRWGARTVLGRPATVAAVTKNPTDVFRVQSLTTNPSMIAVSSEKGSHLKTLVCDGSMVDYTIPGDTTTWWESLDGDEDSNFKLTLTTIQQSILGFALRAPTVANGGAPSLCAPDSFSVRVLSTSGTPINYTGVIAVYRGLPTVAGGGQFLVEFASGDVTGLGQHFVNAGDEGLYFVFDTQQTIGCIQLYQMNNAWKGVALRTLYDGVTSGDGLTLTSATASFTGADTGRVAVAAGMPTAVMTYVNSTTVTLSTAWTPSLTGLGFTVQESRSVQIDDFQLLQVSTTSNGASLSTYSVLATNNTFRARAGYRSAPRGYNGNISGDGLTFHVTDAMAAKGTLTACFGYEISSGLTLILFDGTNTVTFTFYRTGDTPVPANPITITNADSKATVKSAIISAINTYAGALNITASSGSGDIVDLVNDFTGPGGNQQITGTAEIILRAEGMWGGNSGAPFTTGGSSPDIGRLIKLGGDTLGGQERRIAAVVDTNTVTMASAFSGGPLTGQTYDILDVTDFQTFTISAGTYTGPQLVTALNNQILLAMLTDRDVGRFEFFSGPSWNQCHLRTRTKGQDAFLQIDSSANGSLLNTLLGYPSGGAQDFGETLPFQKATGEVLTIVYRFDLNFSTLFTGSAL